MPNTLPVMMRFLCILALLWLVAKLCASTQATPHHPPLLSPLSSSIADCTKSLPTLGLCTHARKRWSLSLCSPGASRCRPTATASLIALLLCGDVESNPGPRPSHKSIYPCGYCQLPVDYGQKAQCCDTCDVWFHHTCVDMSSRTYSSLTRSSKDWFCYRCNSINSSIYHEY